MYKNTHTLYYTKRSQYKGIKPQSLYKTPPQDRRVYITGGERTEERGTRRGGEEIEQEKKRDFAKTLFS